MPRPETGENKQDFISRCMGDAEAVSDFPDDKQRFAVCQSFWDRRDNAEIDFTPPQGVRDAAKRGLELHEEGKSGSGLEPSTVRVARKLAAGEAISEDQARKGNRFWGRNERFLDEPKDSAAYVSALLWGGRPGMSWYRKLYRQLEAREKQDNGKMNTVRVNVKSKVNRKAIEFDERNGRKVIIVPSATLPDDVVMNGIKYPADEIASSFETLNRTPAPLGHPEDAKGDFLAASDPEAINGFYFGAYNENARRENGRVFVDKVIDVERAQENEMGLRVLDAINKGEPIHTSTGLFCNIEECAEDGVDYIARNILFDHDAILLDEAGAATPEQGVGMLVNKAKDGEVLVVNSTIDEDFDREVEWAIESIARAAERKEERKEVEPVVQRIKSAIMEALGLSRETTETNSSEVKMSDQDETKVDDVTAPKDEAPKDTAVNEMTEDKMRSMVQKMVNEYMDEKGPEMLNRYMKDREKAANAAKHDGLVEQVVNKNLLAEEIAKETPTAALEAMLNNAQSGFAAPIHGGFKVNADDKPTFELPEE